MTNQTDPVREQLLDALDFSYCQGLGYATPEALLAAYDADRTPAVETKAALTARAALLAVADWYAEQGTTTLAAGQVAVELRRRADVEMRRMGDTPPTDQTADVTPPPALTEEGRLRARVQVLEEDAERDQGLSATGARCLLRGHQAQIELGNAIVEGHRFALSVKLGLGTGAPWDAIHERVADLSRMADETQPAETDTLPAWLYQRFMAHGVGWDHLDEDDRSHWEHQARAVRRAVARGGFKQPAVGARQDGVQPPPPPV